MLQQVGQHISAARERARQSRERALATTDEPLRADLFEMEKAWLELAKNFETLVSVERFLLDSSKKIKYRLGERAVPAPRACEFRALHRKRPLTS